MPKSNVTLQITELTEIFQRIMVLRPHLRVGVPENMAAMKASLEEERGKGKAGAMNFNQFYNICVLLTRDHESMTMGDLSHALAVPFSTATRIIDWMVERGYVQRLTDPQDRRIVRLSLTDNGQELYQTINQFIHERAELLLHEFTPSERESLVTLMHKLVDALEKYTPATSPKE